VLILCVLHTHAHRMAASRDGNPSIGEEERKLAARDATFAAPIGPSQNRNLSALLRPLDAVPSHLVTVVTQCSTDRLPVLEE
jgi:hypothetical protein